MLMYIHRMSQLEKWMEEHDVTHIHINHGRIKKPIMNMYHRITCILEYVLWGQKVTESYQHEVCMQRYVYMNKGISVMKLQFHDKAWKNKERKIAKGIILREACLRWILEICRCGINYEQLKPVLDHSKQKEVNCQCRHPEAWNSW